MSTVHETSQRAAGSPPVKPGEFRPEVVVLTVSDVDRAKRFHRGHLTVCDLDEALLAEIAAAPRPAGAGPITADRGKATR